MVSSSNTQNQIREDAINIQSDFSNINFTKPFFIHAEHLPRTKTMDIKSDLFEYAIRHLNNDSELSMIIKDNM